MFQDNDSSRRVQIDQDYFNELFCSSNTKYDTEWWQQHSFNIRVIYFIKGLLYELE